MRGGATLGRVVKARVATVVRGTAAASTRSCALEAEAPPVADFPAPDPPARRA